MSIEQLSLLGLDLPETGWTEEDGPKEELAAQIKKILVEKSSMLNEYFSLEIDKSGMIKSLPILLGKLFITFLMLLQVFFVSNRTQFGTKTEDICIETFRNKTAPHFRQGFN